MLGSLWVVMENLYQGIGLSPVSLKSTTNRFRDLFVKLNWVLSQVTQGNGALVRSNIVIWRHLFKISSPKWFQELRLTWWMLLDCVSYCHGRFCLTLLATRLYQHGIMFPFCFFHLWHWFSVPMCMHVRGSSKRHLAMFRENFWVFMTWQGMLLAFSG